MLRVGRDGRPCAGAGVVAREAGAETGARGAWSAGADSDDGVEEGWNGSDVALSFVAVAAASFLASSFSKSSGSGEAPAGS